MGLHLTGKGSILDAIGGALHTGANAVVAGVKDVGDLGAAGLGAITGNQEAEQNALNAIHTNNQNLSGGSFGQNIGGLGSDVMQGVVNPIVRPVAALGVGLGQDLSNSITGEQMALPNSNPLFKYATDNGQSKHLGAPRQLLGNAIQTGVNVATLGKGKAIEQGLEDIAKGGIGRAAVSEGASGLGREGEQAVGQSVFDNSLPARVGARVFASAGTGEAAGAGFGAGNAVANAKNPKEAVSDVVTPAEQLGALGAFTGGVTKVPDVVKTAKANTVPLDEVGGLNNRSVPAPEPPKNMPADIEDRIHRNNPMNPVETNSTEPLPPEPSPVELQQATDNLHHNIEDQAIDWTKVSGANKELENTVNQTASMLQNQDNGLRGGQMQKTADGGYIRTSEHTPFYRKVFEETGRKPTKAAYKEYAKEYIQKKMADPLDAEGQAYKEVARRAQAEQSYSDFVKADKGSGYDKAKYQIPKGTPAKKFVAALYEKTHSPEYRARTAIGQHLGDTRQVLKGIKALRDKSQREYDRMAKNPGTEAEMRAKSAERGSLEGRLRNLTGQEQHYSLAYRRAAEALDAKYPELNLSAQKGVRLTRNQPFGTAKPAEFDESGNVVPSKAKIATAKTEEPYHYQPTNPSEPYTGKNLNEGAFNPDELAKLEVAQRLRQGEQAPLHSIEGDRVVLEGIKRGDSDASLAKAYMEATGADEAAAKAAIGHLENSPHTDSVGLPQNNPKYGTAEKYDLGPAEEANRKDFVHEGLIRIGRGDKSLDKGLMDKVVLSATAPEKLAHIKVALARTVFDKLTPEDQALADKTRGHSNESIIKEAKDPELKANYLKRVRDIGDTLHEDIRNSDPSQEGLLYRRNRGAKFSLEDKNGTPVSAGQLAGQEQNFEKARHFNTYEQVEKASGLKRSSANFQEDLENEVKSMGHFITEHRLVNNLREAFGADAAAHADEGRNTYGMANLKDSTGFHNIKARPDVAKLLNARRFYEYDEGKRGALLKKYDKANAIAKTTKLAFGFFHNINVGLSETALHPTGIPDVARAWESDPFYKESLDRWIDNGTMEKALHGGVTLDAGEEFDKNQEWVKKIPGIKQLHDALFQRQIPFSKMQDFEKYTKGLTLQDDYKDIRGVSRGVNNIYGGINRMVDGISSTNLKMWGRVILATDYNEGQIRTLMSALSKGGKEGEIARRMIGGRMVILASPGTLQGIVTGKAKTPEQIAKLVGHQLFDPSIATPWKTAGGVPKRISLLATVTNKFYRAVAPALNPNNPDKTSGIKQEASGNLAALASLIESEYKNSDYYGNKMRGAGVNPLQAAANAANAVAPIPFGPGARYLEGTHLGKNAVVKTLAGGQSAITPEEAAVDISGVGRGQADPNSPRMQVMNNRQLTVEGLKGNEQAQAGVFAVHPGWNPDLSKQQVADKINDPHYEENKWNALQNPDVFNALKKQNDFAVAHGDPGDPLFKLSPKDQQTVLTYKYLTAVDPGSDSNDKAALIYADNKGLMQNYAQAEADYAKKEQALYSNSGGLQGDVANSPQITPGGVPYPSILQDPNNQKIMDGYTQLLNNGADTATKQQYIADHPEVQQMFDASFNYGNARAKILGQPLEKPYPKADPGLEAWITSYVKGDKATRAGLRNANPGQFSAMQDYMASVDEYLLARTAGQAKYQGHDFSQSNLKQIYNLGNYDIAPTKNADGTTTYSVDPKAAFAAGGGKGGHSSGYKAAYNRSKASNQLKTAKASLRFASRHRGSLTLKSSGHRSLSGMNLKGQPHQPKYVTIKSSKIKTKGVKIKGVA